ncbi:glycosyltransferase family 2 protein, partial [Soonwooa sp.]
MPEVSIITPSYNTEKYIQETISSVLSQTLTDWEWIITDDKSSDKTTEIIEQHKDSRIILIKAEKNGGAGHARNLSLEKASGRFITFLDADDFWEPNFLEEMVNFMKKEKAEIA